MGMMAGGDELTLAGRGLQVAFNAELLMMPKDKDVEVLWIEAL